MSKVKFPYGKLNIIEEKKFNQTIDTNSKDIFYLLRKSLKGIYDRPLGIEGEFVGVVLQKIPSDNTGILSTIQSTLSRITGGPDNHLYRVRVPEVHSMIPEPKGFSDSVAVDLHDAFEWIQGGQSVSLNPGEHVFVRFIDGSSQYRPQILRRIEGSETTFDSNDGSRSIVETSEPMLSGVQPPRGDEFGSGQKVEELQMPDNYIPQGPQQFTDRVGRWLPYIRTVRQNLVAVGALPPNAGSLYTDATILAMIEIETGGNPLNYREKSPFWGLLQQRNDFVFDAYEFSSVGDPFVASNYNGVVSSRQIKIKEKVIKNVSFGSPPEAEDVQFAAGAKAIEATLLYHHRYRRTNSGNPYLIAATHKGGPGATAKALEYMKSGMSLGDALKKYESVHKENKRRAVPNYYSYVYNKFEPAYLKWKSRIS